MSWYDATFRCLSLQPEDIAHLTNDLSIMDFQVQRALTVCMGAERWHLLLSLVEGWCFQSYYSSCCSFFNCFLQKISCADPIYFVTIQRALGHSNIAESSEETLLSFQFLWTIYTTWYRWLSIYTKEGWNVQNRWWRLKK